MELEQPRLGRVVLRFESVSSTNDTAKRLAKRGTPEGTVILAKTQTHGRGRRGKVWFSPPGGLWFSIILRPEAIGSYTSLLPLAAGVAIARTIRRLFGLKGMLKWPNDVTVHGRKIAGVLVETSTGMQDRHTVLGFGINVNNSVRFMSTELGHETTSISDELKSTANVDWLMREILNDFAVIYAKTVAGDYSYVITEWKGHSDMLEKPILVQEGDRSFRAVAFDLDFDGALLVRAEDGTVGRLLSADVSVRRGEPRETSR